ncbi:hypothetical protein D9M71_680580 [compost metagenome]
MLSMPIKVEGKKISGYKFYLLEEYRPPSRGGNTSALHSHIFEIDGEKYSFQALGSQQWIYKSDTVYFEYEINGTYKNVKKETIVTLDKSGKKVERGNRDVKKKLRTAKSKLPTSKREQRD